MIRAAGRTGLRQLFREQTMVRKARRHRCSKHPLDFEVDLGHDVAPPLRIDTKTGAKTGDLDLARSQHRFDSCRKERVGYLVTIQQAPALSPSLYSNNVSTRCACTMSMRGDQANTVKRPSCPATSATESR